MGKLTLKNYEQFWQLQKAANLTNSQAAEWLGVNISTIKRYRNGTLIAPQAVITALKYLIKHGDINA